MTSADEITTPARFRDYLAERSNWGRWGDDDQLGTLNLITAEKRREASRLVREGMPVSLSRPVPKLPASNNPKPSQHFIWHKQRGDHDGAGFASDFLGLQYHGLASTHIDGLCHAWDERGMWQGRRPDDVIIADGATFGSVEHWKDGIFTRGILFDVPRHRGVPYVTLEEPVTGQELEEIADKYGIDPRPGDAVIVHSGREAFSRDEGPYGSQGKVLDHPQPAKEYRPGLHPSCVHPLREWDAGLLIWDMMDLLPDGFDLPWGVHAALHAFGLPLVDNALTQPLADACSGFGRTDCLVTINPLRIDGATGSPANPVAVL